MNVISFPGRYEDDNRVERNPDRGRHLALGICRGRDEGHRVERPQIRIPFDGDQYRVRLGRRHAAREEMSRSPQGEGCGAYKHHGQDKREDRQALYDGREDEEPRREAEYRLELFLIFFIFLTPLSTLAVGE